MSGINFGGLASGMDTESIIGSLMELERQPIKKLEKEQAFLNSESAAYSEFHSKLTNFLDATDELDSISDISSYTATSTDETTLTATTSNSAFEGNYDIEVVSMAEVQKDVSNEGFADNDSTPISGSLNIGGTTIDYNDVTLGDLKDMINAEDLAIGASIIDDGTENGFRLLLTAEDAGVETTISGSGSINIDTTQNGHTKHPTQAHLIIDGIDIYSKENTITNAIPGATLDLLSKTDPGKTMTLSITSDSSAVTEKLDAFVGAYNSVIDWVNNQSGADWGNDTSITTAVRKMQSLVSSTVESSESYTSLISLGFKTDYETGYLSYSETKVDDAMVNNMDEFLNLFAGTADKEGIMDQFSGYFKMLTNSSTGVYATRQESNMSSIKRMDNNIDTLERRLESRETTLRSKFSAMEELVSAMNGQTTYLSAFGSQASA